MSYGFRAGSSPQFHSPIYMVISGLWSPQEMLSLLPIKETLVEATFQHLAVSDQLTPPQ